MYSREQLTKYDYFKKYLDGQRISDVLDQLTGLVSRSHMISFVKSLIEANIPFTFGMIDLDNFKYINDTYGHAAGDGILAAVAEELQKILDGYGVAGRFGGDEFLFVNFRDLEYDDKKSFCIDLFRKETVLTRNYDLNGDRIFVSATAGLASFPHDTQDYSELFLMIDKTLYRGKSKGRNCYIIYLPEKHKDIEIKKLRNNNLYDTFKNLAAAFDSADSLHDKMKAGFKSLINDLHITDMYYTEKNKNLIRISDNRSLGSVPDIDNLMTEEVFGTNQISTIKTVSPSFYQILTENEIEAVLITKILVGTRHYGNLICAEPHTLRFWQENENAIMFFFARMLGDFLHGSQIELE